MKIPVKAKQGGGRTWELFLRSQQRSINLLPSASFIFYTPSVRIYFHPIHDLAEKEYSLYILVLLHLK